MADLRTVYLARLPSRLTALRTAAEQIAAGHAEAAETARRIGHMLRGSASSFGFAEIGQLAERVERATAATLHDAVGELTGYMERILASAGSLFRILIVEDDADLAQELERRLADPTRHIETAATGAAALDAVSRESVDLVLLDIILPDLDGRDVLLRLREDSRTAAVPVIVLSVRGGEALQQECLALGAEVYLEKPVDMDALDEQVANELQRSAMVARDIRSDALTDLPNRVALEVAFHRCLARSLRSDDPVTLAILDLDRFKEINDRLGHAAGDEALKFLASFLKARLRQTDVAARWGGDEFVILFESTRTEEAVRVLEILQSDLHRAEGGDPALRFSAGVAAARGSLAETLARADAALYRGKEAGRGQVVSENEQLEISPVWVLVVEDDPEAAMRVEEALATLGLASTIVTGVPEAQTKLRESRPLMAILDRDLEGSSGLELLSWLRNEEEFRDLPVVMVTSAASSADIEMAFRRGADDYVSKPFSPRELRARVQRLLEREAGLRRRRGAAS